MKLSGHESQQPIIQFPLPCRGLTSLTWISGALCRNFAVRPVCPLAPRPFQSPSSTERWL